MGIMKNLLLFGLLLLVAGCGEQEEVYSSIEGRWFIENQSGIVDGYFDIEGGLVVFAEFSIDGNQYEIPEPIPVEPYRIILDNWLVTPRGSIYFEGYQPNADFTRMSVGITAVRRANSFDGFTDIYLKR